MPGVIDLARPAARPRLAVPSLWPPIAPVRRLGPGDRGLVERHLLALAPGRRVERFGRAMTDEGVLRHCAALDLGRDLLLGRLAPDLLGLAELAPDPSLARVEIAATFDDRADWRQVGEDLLDQAVEEAGRLGAFWLVADAGSEEVRLPSLLRARGAVRVDGRLLLPLRARAADVLS